MKEEDLLEIADERHGLAYRKLRGEVLSAEELQRLERLNEIIRQTLPPHQELPAEVLEAMAAIKKMMEGKKE